MMSRTRPPTLAALARSPSPWPPRPPRAPRTRRPLPDKYAKAKGIVMITSGSVLTLAGFGGILTSTVIMVSTAGSDVSYTGIGAIGLAVSGAVLAGGIPLIVFGARKLPKDAGAPSPPPATAKLLVGPSSFTVDVSF